jgi:hypothetical protein
MSVGRVSVVLAMVLGLLLTAAALAQGTTIQARSLETTYTVELPGELKPHIVCTGDARTSTADCVESIRTMCPISEVSFRERAGSPAKTCKVSNCGPKPSMAAASAKCVCQIRVSDCR